MKKLLSLLLCITVILSAFSFVIPVYADSEESFIDYLYYDDFSTTGKMTNYFTGYNPTIKIWDPETNAILDAYKSQFSIENEALKVQNTTNGAVTRVGFRTPAPTNKPKLVLSFKVKLNFTSNAGYGFGSRDQYGTGTLYMTDTGAIRAHSAGNSAALDTTYQKGEWVNVTLVYDNDSANGDTRDVYINNVNYGAFNTPSTTWSYATKGYVEFLPQFYSVAGNTCELDNFEVYAYPETLKYQLVSASGNEIKLAFNMIPDASALVPANFTVKTGSTVITPATVQVSATDSRQVVLTFEESLAPGKAYTVSAADITAGGDKSDDVSDTISLASSPELSFSVAPAEVEWKATSEFFAYDYENLDVHTITSNVETSYGTFEMGSTGLYKIETDGANKFLTLQQNGTSATESRLRFLPRKGNFASGNAYAIELKLKTDFSANPENAMFDARTDSGWGLPFTALHNGAIYTDSGLHEIAGVYNDGDWITLKNVYYSTPVVKEDVEYLRRDIYINGQFIKTEYESWANFGKMVTGSTSNVNCSLNFRVRDKFVTMNTEGKVYIDYIRAYKTDNGFASKLTSASEIDTGFINVQFNNIPVEADLTDKIYIAEEDGTKVSDIAVPEYINEFNVDGYAAKVNLWFANELERGKTYKLCISGVTDIMGNTLYQEESFTTKTVPEAEGLALSGGIATVTVNEYSEPLTLIVAGYEVVDGVEQMVKVVEKTITAAGTFSTDTAVTGDVVKAFLWKGTKPVISAVE